jgi:hypothetical protein
MAARLIAGWLVVAVMLAGPLPLASAQQAPPPEDIRYETRPRRTDGYDVGAGVITVLKMPFNVGLCALGGAVGAALFAVTLGSGYRASTRLVEEGCGGPWVVRGDDLRPDNHPNRTDRAWSYGAD